MPSGLSKAGSPNSEKLLRPKLSPHPRLSGGQSAPRPAWSPLPAGNSGKGVGIVDSYLGLVFPPGHHLTLVSELHSHRGLPEYALTNGHNSWERLMNSTGGGNKMLHSSSRLVTKNVLNPKILLGHIP